MAQEPTTKIGLGVFENCRAEVFLEERLLVVCINAGRRRNKILRIL